MRSFVTRQEKMPPRRGVRRGGGRGGRGAGHTQPEEQPVVQAANPNALITQAISPRWSSDIRICYKLL
ncbi:hypothetical protein E5676_scaffold121G001260 [Cucumis melo var. makuwa]|uniref:Gag protease polyprotein n=1 Tax=Cucumis melo var. makuwa TaxID=1194695 RepID=A0A5A7TGT1_CUCMM|nr:hypothetical protein E6C27_scaffold266G00220 [Cucumis melo var. makuwa]TYK03505.1 hypothetical protein E5676_scaffold121G001260 [Cucumis melo var. makuwa]